MPSRKMSPACPSEKPRRRTSSSPVSPAWKVTPAVVLSTSRKSSRLRSSSSRSVMTVTFCGMSRRDCSPLPRRVVAGLRVLLERISAGSDCPVTVTVSKVPAVPTVWATACRLAASSMAPSGRLAPGVARCVVGGTSAEASAHRAAVGGVPKDSMKGWPESDGTGRFGVVLAMGMAKRMTGLASIGSEDCGVAEGTTSNGGDERVVSLTPYRSASININETNLQHEWIDGAGVTQSIACIDAINGVIG